MKPIDAISGLPRSPEIARLVAAQGHHGEIQAQGQVSGFAREMREKQFSVNEAPKTEGGNVDTEGGGDGGNVFYDSQGRKKGHDESKEPGGSDHPSKGKILDIRGA